MDMSGDASMSPDPAAAPADPNAMMDPNMMGDPNAAADPNAAMGGDMNGDGMPDEPAPDASAGMSEGDDIQGIYDGLNDDHKKAVRKYAEAMEDMENESGNEMGGDAMSADPNAMPPADPNAAPMMETVIFTKGQLKKMNEELNNGNMDKKEPKEKPLDFKKDRGYKKNSPFDAPKFKS